MKVWWLISMLCGMMAGFAQEEEPLENVQVLPDHLTRQQIFGIMRGWASDLGVRCNHCHVSPTGKFEDTMFEDDSKQTKKTAREMYKMAVQINDMFFKERDTKVGCYTCHHGTTDPRKLDDILRDSLSEGNIAAVEETYRSLREKYYGQGAYNFAPWSGLSTVAGEVFADDRLEDARKLHELNLEFNPDYDGSHFAIAAYHMINMDDRELALTHLQKAMDGNSFWTPRRTVRLASQLKQKGMPEQRLLSLQLLVEVDPENAIAHYQLGRCLQDTGNQQAAREAYEKAVQLNPEYEEAKQAMETLKQ